MFYIASKKFPNHARNKLTTKCLLMFLNYTRLRLEYVKDNLGSQIYTINYRFMFVIENLVYQNNRFIIIYSNTIGKSSIQHTTLNQLSITKQTFLNIYHFHQQYQTLTHSINH